MAAGRTVAASLSNLPDFLVPFYNRATEAEERLASLEAALHTNDFRQGGDSPISELVELRQRIEKAKVEREAEKDKSAKEQERLLAEIAKLQYRITHLLKALKEADEKLARA